MSGRHGRGYPGEEFKRRSFNRQPASYAVQTPLRVVRCASASAEFEMFMHPMPIRFLRCFRLASLQLAGF